MVLCREFDVTAITFEDVAIDFAPKVPEAPETEEEFVDKRDPVQRFLEDGVSSVKFPNEIE